MGLIMETIKQSAAVLTPIFVTVFACLACFYVTYNFGIVIGIAYWVVQSIVITVSYFGTIEYKRRKNV